MRRADRFIYTVAPKRSRAFIAPKRSQGGILILTNMCVRHLLACLNTNFYILF